MKKNDVVGLMALSSIISTQIFYFTSDMNIIFSTILMAIGILCPGIIASMYQKEHDALNTESVEDLE